MAHRPMKGWGRGGRGEGGKGVSIPGVSLPMTFNRYHKRKIEKKGVVEPGNRQRWSKLYY